VRRRARRFAGSQPRGRTQRGELRSTGRCLHVFCFSRSSCLPPSLARRGGRQPHQLRCRPRGPRFQTITEHLGSRVLMTMRYLVAGRRGRLIRRDKCRSSGSAGYPPWRRCVRTLRLLPRGRDFVSARLRAALSTPRRSCCISSCFIAWTDGLSLPHLTPSIHRQRALLLRKRSTGRPFPTSGRRSPLET